MCDKSVFRYASMHLISCLDENKGKYDILDAKKLNSAQFVVLVI